MKVFRKKPFIGFSLLIIISVSFLGIYTYVAKVDLKSLFNNLINSKDSNPKSLKTFNISCTDPASTTIRLINRGNSSCNFEIVLNGINFSSLEAIINFIKTVPDAKDGEPIYQKTWRVISSFSRHNCPITDRTWMHSPTLYLNSLGFGFCDDIATILYAIWHGMGYNARIWCLEGHYVSEVWTDNHWEMYDGDLGVYYYNETLNIIGVEDLMQNASYITNPINPISTDSFAYSSYFYYYYSTKDDNYVDDYAMENIPTFNITYTLMPNGSIIFPNAYNGGLPCIENEMYYGYNTLDFTIPAKWTGKVENPLAIKSITGTGRICVNDTYYDIGSSALTQFVNERCCFMYDFEIIEAQSQIEIKYITNPKVFSLKSDNRIDLFGMVEGIELERIDSVF